MKKCFVLILAMLIFLCGCTDAETEIDTSVSTVEKTENETIVPESDPIVYSAEDILADDSSETVVRYNSIYALDYISETIPQNHDAENSEDGYIGDNVIAYDGEKEILRTPVYIQGEPDAVHSVSLSRVQWLDGETVMIDGRLLYSTETNEKYEFNADWENVLNYALNKKKDKLAVSSMDEDKTLYRLSVYDFATKKWETLLEEKSDRIYYFGANLVWKGNDEIVFSAGIKRESFVASPEEELDIYVINAETRECTLLLEKAYLMCDTGSLISDRMVCSKDVVGELNAVDSEIWIYDFETESAFRIDENGIHNQFWLPQKGLFGFYSEAEKCLKLYCDSTYAMLGKVDLESVIENSDDIVRIDPDADYIRFSVYERANGTSKRYKVNISDIRERNYFFIDHLYIGYTELGEFYNRTHSENVYGEFLTQDGFDVYSQDRYISRATEVEFDIVPGLDNFFEEKYAELLRELASSVSEDQQSGVFKLPVSMSEEAFNVPYYDYNGFIDFGVGNVITNKEFRLVTNAKHNILPRKVEKVTANENDLEIIRKELERGGITKAPINVSEVLLCDLDGDGADERIIFANSSADKFVGDADSGNYTMAFVVRENGVEFLHKQTSRYGETIPDLETWENYFDHWVNHSSCAGIYDLNGDGKFEICMELGMYEHGRYMVFSENEDGKYSLVLVSESGT